MNTEKLNYKNYNIIILIVFTVAIVLFINYDLLFMKKIENFELENELTNNKTEEFTNNSGNYLVNQRRDKLMLLLNKFKRLEIPIYIDDLGVVCKDWKNDPKKRFPNKGNKCQIINDDTYCVNSKGTLNTCNKLYNENIRKMSQVDVNSIVIPAFNKLKIEFRKIDKEIGKKQIDLDDTLNRLISKKNIIEQQKFFIKQNTTQINESKNISKDISDKYDKFNNTYHISKMESTNLKQLIENQNDENDKILKIIYGVLIIVIILVVFSLLLTRL